MTRKDFNYIALLFENGEALTVTPKWIKSIDITLKEIDEAVCIQAGSLAILSDFTRRPYQTSGKSIQSRLQARDIVGLRIAYREYKEVTYPIPYVSSDTIWSMSGIPYDSIENGSCSIHQLKGSTVLTFTEVPNTPTRFLIPYTEEDSLLGTINLNEKATKQTEGG